MSVNLGDKVKDSVTGLEGIVTGKTDYLNGCTRVHVQPQELKDGKPVDFSVFDEPQLEVIQRDAVKADRRPSGEKTGGPRPDTPTRSTERR